MHVLAECLECVASYKALPGMVQETAISYEEAYVSSIQANVYKKF